MRLKNLDLIVAILIVALNIGWMEIPDHSALVGLILAIPLVLFFSGYTLAQVLFRKRAVPGESDQTPERSGTARQGTGQGTPLRLGHPIGKADEIVISLGLSMAIDILVGFGLNLLSIGLQSVSWTLSLGLLTVLFALLALFLRRKDTSSTAKKMSRPPITLPDVLFLLLAAFVVGSSFWLAIIRPSKPQPSFTQFWMLPANQTDKSCEVSLGIQSFEVSSVTYTVSISVNSAHITNNVSPIVLAPQQKWSQQLPITPEGRNNLYVDAQLYRTTDPQTVYRDVHLTFHVVDQNGQTQPQCSLGT